MGKKVFEMKEKNSTKGDLKIQAVVWKLAKVESYKHPEKVHLNADQQVLEPKRKLIGMAVKF